MAKFTDGKQREWVVDINMGTIKAKLKPAGLNFYVLAENKYAGYMALYADYLALTDWLWALCSGQHEGVTQHDFDEGLAGGALQAARDAFYEEYENFTPDSLTRSNLSEWRSNMRKFEEKMSRKLKEKTARMLEVGGNRLDQEIEATFSDDKLQKIFDAEMRKLNTTQTSTNEASTVSLVS